MGDRWKEGKIRGWMDDRVKAAKKETWVIRRKEGEA